MLMSPHPWSSASTTTMLGVRRRAAAEAGFRPAAPSAAVAARNWRRVEIAVRVSLIADSHAITVSMNRRSFLAGCGGAAMSARAAADRPNILFLFCDDWGRYASAYRDPRRPGINDVVRTPHIDRVAREGALFTNAFMATPSCTPSRAAVATGCYSWRTGRTANLKGGAWEGQRDPGADLPGFGRALEREGYLVRSSYKTLSPAWLGGKSYGRREFLRFSQYVSQAGSSTEIARRREQYVDQARQGIPAVVKERGAGQPFFYAFGPINAHRPWIRQSGTKLWGIDPEALKSKLPAFLPDIPLVRQDVADYLGEVQALDL